MPIKGPLPKLANQQASILLTIIALSLWSYSVLHARLEIGFFGLIHGLHITFFVGLASLAIASAILWSSRERHGKLLCLQLLILVSALWLIPTVTGGSPPVTNHAYRNLGMVDYMVSYGHFSNKVVAYLSWPGTFIISAITTEVSLLNLETLVAMGLVPFLMQLLCLAPLYVFLRNTLGKERSNYCWLGCWLFYLAEWIVHVHLNPQGFGFFFLLILLALVTNPKIWQNDTRRTPFFVVIMLIFAALAVTHLLTSLAVSCVLIGLCLLKKDKRMALVIATCIIMLASWNLVGARMLWEKIETSEGFVTIQQTTPPRGTVEPTNPPGETVKPTNPPKTMLVLDPELITEREVTRRMSGSQAHIALTNMRLLFSSIFVLIGLAGAIMVCLFRRSLKMGIPLLIISLAPLVLLSLSYQYGELLPRIYLFALPGMAYFGAMLMDMKSKILPLILCLVLVFCCPLHVISRYGNQEIDYISQAELLGVGFFHNRTSKGYVVGSWPIGVMKNIDKYTRTSLGGVDWGDIDRLIARQAKKHMPVYVSISRQDEKRDESLRGDTVYIDNIKETTDIDSHYDFIYNNPDLVIYIASA